jgi:hypothetical protein
LEHEDSGTPTAADLDLAADCWLYIMVYWRIAGVGQKDLAIARDELTLRVIGGLTDRMFDGPATMGLMFNPDFAVFRLKRNTVRQILQPDWLVLQRRDDRQSRKILRGLQQQLNVFYQGKPFYDRTTRFVLTDRFEAWRARRLRWADLELPAAELERIPAYCCSDPAEIIPYFGTVVIGYEKRDTIYLGITPDPLVLALLRASARYDLRGNQQRRNGPLFFSPAERAQWLAAPYADLALFSRLFHRVREPGVLSEPERLELEEAFDDDAPEEYLSGEERLLALRSLVKVMPRRQR